MAVSAGLSPWFVAESGRRDDRDGTEDGCSRRRYDRNETAMLTGSTGVSTKSEYATKEEKRLTME